MFGFCGDAAGRTLTGLFMSNLILNTDEAFSFHKKEVLSFPSVPAQMALIPKI